MKESKYYVYEWIRLDTNEPFYVGKGCNNRWKETLSRNDWFLHVINKIPCAVNILHDNLDEETAFGLEVWYIREYRDIIGYNMCNISDGGEGSGLTGEANGFYGKHHTEESKEKIGKKSKERNQGKDNPFYRKHHTEESKNKMRGRVKSQEEIDKIRKGVMGKACYYEENPNSKKIICLNTLKVYNCIKLAIEEFESEAIYKVISNNCPQKSIKYNGESYYFMYYDEYLNSTEEEIKNRMKSNKDKRVICLNTLEVFSTVKSAKDKYNICSVSDCCRGKIKYCGKLNGENLVWMYYNEYLLLSEEEIKYKIKIANKNKGGDKN